MQAATADTESLRREQSARVRAAHGLLVAPDVLGHLERCQEAVRQSASSGVDVVAGFVVITKWGLIGVGMVSHRVLRDLRRRAGDARLT